MKRVICVLFAALLLWAAGCGCGKKSGDITGVSMAAQEYPGANIYEIPRFEGKGEIAVQLNAAVQERLFYYISGWEATKNDDTFWYQIKSYPMCGSRYRQVVITAIELPNYGTDGDVYSFCYDSQTGGTLTLDDALSQAGVSRETMEQGFATLLPGFLREGDVAVTISYPAFAFAGGELCVVARVFIENDITEDQRDELFVYNLAQNAISEYDGVEPLFPAGLCDQLDPPLDYSRTK